MSTKGNTPDNIKLDVDQFQRISQGFLAYCVHPNEPEYLERIITTDELKDTLWLDWQGRIMFTTTFDNAEGDPVEVDRPVTLDEWIDEVGEMDVCHQLSIAINKKEGRTEFVAKPLADMPDIGATIQHLTSTIPNLKTGKAA